ncbi:MAG: DUF5343 domain-containing protein [Dehalococcoidia bacterium]
MVRDKETEGGTLEGLPPYAPHSAWRRLIDGLRASVPKRVDQSYFGKYRFDQSTRSMLLNALRFLGMVDRDGYATEELKTLVKRQGEEYSRGLRVLVQRSYGPLLADTDLTTATPDLLRERFRAEGARGDVARKCASFLVALASDAGIPLSPHIRRRRRQPRGQSIAQGARRSPGASAVKRPAVAGRPSRSAIPEGSRSSLAALVADKFPNFDPEWDRETVERWRESFRQLLETVLRGEAPQTG